MAEFWPKASYKMVILAFARLGRALAVELVGLLAVKTRTNAKSKAAQDPVVIFAASQK
jgi:hypothetical protein